MANAWWSKWNNSDFVLIIIIIIFIVLFFHVPFFRRFFNLVIFSLVLFKDCVFIISEVTICMYLEIVIFC